MIGRAFDAVLAFLHDDVWFRIPHLTSPRFRAHQQGVREQNDFLDAVKAGTWQQPEPRCPHPYCSACYWRYSCPPDCYICHP